MINTRAPDGANNEIIQTNTGNLGIPNWGLRFHDRAEIYWEDQRKRWAEETKYWRQLYCDQIMWFNIEDNKFAWSPYLCTVSTTLCPHDIPEWCFSRRKFCLPSQKHPTYCASLHQKHSGKFWKYVILFSIQDFWLQIIAFSLFSVFSENWPCL